MSTASTSNRASEQEHTVRRDPLETLRRQYFALTPPRLLHLPPAAHLAQSSGQAFLRNQILSDAHLPQPEDGYRRGFWRKVVRYLEEGIEALPAEDEPVHLTPALRAAEGAGVKAQVADSQEVDERFYEVLSGLMVDQPGSSSSLSSNTSTGPKQSYRSFIYDLPLWCTPPGIAADARSADQAGGGSSKGKERERAVTLLEEQTVLQGGSTGLRTWTAALRFAEHILRNPDIFSQNEYEHEPPASRHAPNLPLSIPPLIIELGAGTGFLSVLLAQLGADVVATDLNLETDDGAQEEDDAERKRSADIGYGVHDALHSHHLAFEQNALRQAPLGRLRHNISINRQSMRGSIVALPLDWTDGLRDASSRPAIWGRLQAERRTVVAADVIYDPDLIPPLVATIRTLIQPQNSSASNASLVARSQAIIAATVRNPDTLNLFSNHIRGSGMTLEIIRPARPDAEQPIFWDSGLDAAVPVQIMRIRPGPGVVSS